MSDVAAISEQPESKPSPAAAVLDREATARSVRLLFANGLIDDLGRRDALRMLHGPLDWWRWIDRALVFLGLVLVLAGVICFFAWNWAALHPFVKLGLVEGAILVSCGVAWWRGLDSPIGQAAQLAGAVFVGVFLAVYGQIYQTGADAYELFVGWALLILPWVALARFAGLWMFWIALVNLALVLAWEQVLNARGLTGAMLYVAMALLNGGFAALREFGWRRGWPWLQQHWVRWLLVPAMLVPLMISAIELIVGVFGPNQTMDRWIPTALLIAILPLAGRYFRHSAPDLLSLTYVVTCVCALLDFGIGRALFGGMQGDDMGRFLLMGMIVIGTVSAATMWLLRELRRQRDDPNTPKRQRGRTLDSDRELSGIRPGGLAAGDARSQTPAASALPLSGQTPATSMGQLLARLQEDGHFAISGLEQAAKLLMHDSEDETPWFVMVLVGFGAWIACLCFVICLAIAGAFDQMVATGVMGLLGTAAAIFIHRLMPHLFARQFALAAGLTGYVMLLVAAGSGAQGLMPAVVASVVLSVVVYPLYPSGVFRFLLAAAPQLMFVIASWDWRWQNQQNSNELIHLLVLIQTAGVGVIFAWRPKPVLWPAGYALATGLLATLLLTTSEFRQMQAWPSSVIQVAAEMWLITWLMSAGKRRNPTLILLSAGACALIGVLSAPGVLAAVGILLLGHLERDNLLRSLGLLFLPVYLVAFYYDFNTTLLLKSGMLVGTGLVLWLARVIASRQVARQEVSGLVHSG
ncbi:MAG: DUF4401 domain-containing protein [Planctomycetaceae bacterium]